MNKVAIIEHCKACPHSTYITTIDPKHPRIYLGCHLVEPSRSFDFMTALTDRPPIPGWCPLPDAKGMISFSPENTNNPMIPIHDATLEKFQAWREQEKRAGR